VGQFFGNEKITKLVKSSNTIVSLPSGSILKVGGQGYNDVSSLICTTSTSGFGGIDVGSVAASTFYYVYIVSNSGVLGLVASTSATSPTGFASYRKVGAFYTDGSSNVFAAYWFNQVNQTVFSARVIDGAGTTTVINEGPADFISGVFTNATTGNYVGTLISNLFSIAPNADIQATVDHGRAFVDTTTTTVTVGIRNAAGAGEDSDFFIKLHKANIDATQPDWSL